MPEIKVVPLGAGQDVGRSCIIVTLGLMFINLFKLSENKLAIKSMWGRVFKHFFYNILLVFLQKLFANTISQFL